MASTISTDPRKKGADSSVQKAHSKMIARQKAIFDEMPKETVRIREEDGNQWVQVNGYAYQIKATGEPVEVPRQIAEMLRRKGVA